MTDSNCLFCKIVDGQLPCYKVYEDDSVIAFLDIFPVGDGHTLIIPKKHSELFHECSDEVVSSVALAVKKVGQAVIKAFGVEGYNVLCNNGSVSGQVVGHVHYHVIPRKSGDGILTGWPKAELNKGQAEEILDKIQQQL